MKIVEWQANVTMGQATALAHWVVTTAEDKLTWKPQADGGGVGRSVLEIAQECVGTNRRLAAMLRGEQPASPAPGATISTAAEAKEELLASAKEFADTLRSLDDSVLQQSFESPFGPVTGAFVIVLAANHMGYHGGQINYIQVLYGDTQFRFPGRD